MLDVHPPHHPVHAWRDFFIHIATIVVGLLIAIGLEQTVEYFHHRHERSELTEQMRKEAEQNLPLVRDSISRMLVQAAYIGDLRAALLAGKVSGDTVEVHGVLPRGGSVLHVSPSRSAWAAAQSGGVTAILPAGQAQLYARRDFNAELEVASENRVYEELREMVGQCDRAGFRYNDPAPMRLTLAQRGDVLLAADHLELQMEEMSVRLALVEGADEAVADGATTLEAMFPYQRASVSRLHLGNGLSGGFFGATSDMDYKPVQSAQPEKH